MGIWAKLKRWAEEATRPGAFVAGGREVVCPHCRSGTFSKGSLLLGAGAIGSPLKWGLTCERCGLVLCFKVEPERRAEGTSEVWRPGRP